MNSNKKTEYFETLIIGGGPAGTACGLTLLKNKKIVCIIERGTYPREKLCAGALTQKTLERLEELGLPLLQLDIPYYKTNSFTVLDKKKTQIKVECTDPYILVNRIEFDDALIKKYKENKGILREGETVTHIDLDEKIVTTNKQKYRYHELVCADGAMGVSSKYTDKKKRNLAFCLEMTIPAHKKYDSIQLDTGIFKKGYAWIFPKGNRICIGFAGTNYKEKDYKKIFQSYFEEELAGCSLSQLKGAFLPFGKCDKKISQKHGNLLLVGDAAGFIDVVTGEGIYYALTSGMMAAESIVEGNGDFNRTCKYYKKKAKPLITTTNLSNLTVIMFYRFRKFFYWLVRRFPGLLVFFCRIQIARNLYNYNAFKMLWALIKDGGKNEKQKRNK